MAKTENLDEMPTSIDPYEVLGVSKTATESEIKSAYKKLALKRHPDKAPPGERETAHAAFQSLALAYAVLSEPKRRTRYDRTGSTEESIVDDDGFDWTEYFRTQFSEVVTTERIEEIKRDYQGSEEERQDILNAYTKHKGNLDKIFETVLLSDVLDDEQRFREIIKTATESGDVYSFDKFTKETEKTREKRRKRALKERKEAELATAEGSDDVESEQQGTATSEDEPPSGKESTTKVKAKSESRASSANTTKASAKAKKGKKAKGSSMNDLAALIQQRHAGRASAAEAFFDSLEAKYSGNTNTKKGQKRQAEGEPPEEAFAEMAKRGRKKK